MRIFFLNIFTDSFLFISYNVFNLKLSVKKWKTATNMKSEFNVNESNFFTAGNGVLLWVFRFGEQRIVD